MARKFGVSMCDGWNRLLNRINTHYPRVFNIVFRIISIIHISKENNNDFTVHLLNRKYNNQIIKLQ